MDKLKYFNQEMDNLDYKCKSDLVGEFKDKYGNVVREGDVLAKSLYPSIDELLIVRRGITYRGVELYGTRIGGGYSNGEFFKDYKIIYAYHKRKLKRENIFRRIYKTIKRKYN